MKVEAKGQIERGSKVYQNGDVFELPDAEAQPLLDLGVAEEVSEPEKAAKPEDPKQAEPKPQAKAELKPAAKPAKAEDKPKEVSEPEKAAK